MHDAKRIANDHRFRSACHFLLASLLFFSNPAIAAGAVGGNIDLEIVGQQATLNAENADFHEILHRLAEHGDFRLWISERLPPRNLTLQVEKRPLAALLDRLLEPFSYALVVDPAEDKVTELFVLAPGDAPPSRVELNSGVYPDREAVLRDALSSPDIPDSIKLSMMAQHNAATTAPREADMTRIEAISRIVEQIERNATANPETIRALRQGLERMRGNEN